VGIAKPPGKRELNQHWKRARGGLRWLYSRFLAASGCFWWAKRRLRADGAVVALTFHRVLGDPNYQQTHSQAEIIIREQTFRELVAHVAHCYEPVDLGAITPGIPSEKPKVAFTFDDGWQDNYAVAFPIAREYRIPFIVFLCSELIGKQRPFWPEKVIALLKSMYPQIADSDVGELIEKLKKCTADVRERCLAELSKESRKHGASLEASSCDGTLSWREIAEMDRAGVRFGSHTQTHQILTFVETEVARNEVLESKATLEKALGKNCGLFSYPNGTWSPETRRIVKEAGYSKAVTVDCGAWTSASDLLCIPRINVHEDTVVGPTGHFSPALFDYATFWKAWRATRANSRPEIMARARCCA
jgi:peptidoglycan/xylan/chitin deacetylase (PgdA/CDA1 family)